MADLLHLAQPHARPAAAISGHSCSGSIPNRKRTGTIAKGAAKPSFQQTPLMFPICFPNAISGKHGMSESGLSLWFQWWAHKGSNLGPA